MAMVNIKTAAAHLGIKVCALRKLVRKGCIPFTMISGKYMFSLQLLEEFFMHQMIKSIEGGDENGHHNEGSGK